MTVQDDLVDAQQEIRRLKKQLEDAHNMLDHFYDYTTVQGKLTVHAPREIKAKVTGNVLGTYTVAGRIEMIYDLWKAPQDLAMRAAIQAARSTQ